MTELERTQRAIGAAMAYLRDKTDPEAVETLQYINGMIKPAPVYETVEEIVGWVNVYQRPDGSLHATSPHPDEAAADTWKVEGRISCQPIKVTVQREKKAPVERSVTVERVLWQVEGLLAYPMGGKFSDADKMEGYRRFVNKTGTLTFTWLEEP